MNYSDFLKTTQILRMLYGQEVATIFFENNVVKYYNLTSEDLATTLDSATLKNNQ